MKECNNCESPEVLIFLENGLYFCSPECYKEYQNPVNLEGRWK